MSDPEDSTIHSMRSDRNAAPHHMRSGGQESLPKSPTPGKCYIRCVTPESYKMEKVVYPVYTGGDIDPNDLDTLTLVLNQKISRWEYRSRLENCKSNDPRDCMVLCYVEYPEETIKIVVVNNTENTDVFEYRTFGINGLTDPGGVAVWEEIDCKLTDYNDLPVYFEKNSSILNEDSKRSINNKLLGLLLDKPNIRIEISSHTDARGDALENRKLSELRAKAVVDHLISEGIQRSRLVARGYGEDHLKNHCKDGVECTEAEHAENQRTEFRVLFN